MRTTAFLALFGMAISINAFAGDYTLTISNDPAASCTIQARQAQDWCREQIAKGAECSTDLSWPIHTTDEVIESLDQYFNDEQPTIRILLAAFSNGHLTFCTTEERCKVLRHLLKLKASGSVKNKRHLNDFIGIISVKDDKCLHNQAL